MIEYIHDASEKYKEDLLFHLGKHNDLFVARKDRIEYYIYTTKNNVLLGAMKVSCTWDWINISELFYESTDVLSNLLDKLYELLKEEAVGTKIYSLNKQVICDFVQFGFTEGHTFNPSPKRGTYYYAFKNCFTVNKAPGYHSISSKSIVNEYTPIFKQKVDEYKKKFSEPKPVEYLHFAALDGEIFAGGIYLEMFEDSLYVDLLAVNEKYRGNQIGKKLMLKAEEVAVKRGYVSMDVGTAEFQARAFYEKLGYTVVDTTFNQPNGYECYHLLKKL